MASRVIIRDKIAATNETRLQRRDSQLVGNVHKGYYDRDGGFIDTRPISADSPASPFRAGFAYTDPDDDITYRIVPKLDIQGDGWGTAAFWVARYGLDTEKSDNGLGMRLIREWCARGWLDAAMEERNPTKRYRCRDERKIYDHLRELHSKKNSLGPGTKEKIRHAILKLKKLFGEA